MPGKERLAMTAHLVFCCLVLGLVPVVSDAAESNTEGVRCSLVVWNRYPLPYEPGGVLVQLHSGTHEVRTVHRPWTGLSYRNAGDGDWRVYEHFGDPRCIPPGPGWKVVLQPGETTTTPLFVDYDTRTSEHVFPQLGAYEIKAHVSSIESEVLRIEVRKPEWLDAIAYQALVKRPPEREDTAALLRSMLPLVFAERWPIFSREDTILIEDALAEFAAAHRGSTYATFARLGLAIAWIQGVDGKVDVAKAQEVLLPLSRIPDRPLAARALYYLGIASRKARDTEAATQYYKGALQAGPDPFYAYLCEQALKGRWHTYLLP